MRRLLLIACLACFSATSLVSTRNGPKFYNDDPIWIDPETQDASGAQPYDPSDAYDLVENSFLKNSDRTDKRAVNVNTVDEVPDSSWFTNRIGPLQRNPMDIPAIVKGPNTSEGPADGTWTIVGRKSEGVTPGFTIRDRTGEIYWIKFDPSSNPEMASGAEVISTKFFHALGYNVPENYLATLRTDQLVIAEGAMMKDEDGKPRQMTAVDVDNILERAARNEDGTYRVLASRNLPGRILGPFRYYGTRPDDPNDIHPHEHRRELRGLRVFAAWLNHDEVRASNSLDSILTTNGRGLIKHHLIDFGSTLGSGSVKSQSRRAGNEFVWESRPTLITMLTLGLYVRPWIKVDYPDLPAVGRIESTYYRPENWKSDYPNPAFRNARPEDFFWGARIVAGFSDEVIRAIVDSARYSNKEAADYLLKVILERKGKVLAEWLNGTNPLINFALDSSGRLTFENAAEKHGVAKAAERYTIQWSRFDNKTSTHAVEGAEETFTSASTRLPASLASAADYVSARVRAHHADHPQWSQPVVVYFRRSGDGWTLVGLERNP